MRTPPAARIASTTLAAGRLRVGLRCPRVRGGCRGVARVAKAGPRGATAARYRLRSGRRGTVRVPLPAAVRRKLARRGWAVVHVETRELDSQRRPRTQQETVLLSRR